MKIRIIILLLILPLGIFSQTKTFTDLTNAENKWITLGKDWHYQKGDNLDWAQADFNDSSWKTFSSLNLNMIDSVAIAEKNEIVWFRKYIKIDRLLNDEFVIEIDQQGASEIYLDGKLIHKFGTVSNNPDEIENYNPDGAFFNLPIVKGKEHVLAVRYVNSQYKYPENRRYPGTNGYIRLTTTLRSTANAQRTLTIKDSTFMDQWTWIAKYWRFQKGDNSHWAKPDFDDSSWDQFSSTNLNRKDGEAIAKRGEIMWFRRPIKIDSSFNDATVLRIYQYRAASEIYLDGEFLHKLGNISSNPDEFESNIPSDKILSLPLLKNKEHVLAIRFQNSNSNYPIYQETEGNMWIQISSLNNVLNNGPELYFKNNERSSFLNNIYMVLGIGILMFVLFFCLYLFFPREKINGYFALTSFFFSCFIVFVIFDVISIGNSFKYQVGYGLLTVAYCLTLLFCIYRIFNKRLGYIFWSITILGILSIPLLFYFYAGYVSPILGVVILLETLRISIISIKSDKIGAVIFLTFGGINCLYWIIVLLHRLTSIELPNLYIYQPLAFAFLPLSIAIYLGYIFGKRSQSLRLNLERVQKLSNEKESILSRQNETLEQQVKQRTTSLNQSIENLKATQAQLIQSEKMASLGELTAGIAHEIQNPLNFVNNFSEVSEELIVELKEEIQNNSKDDIDEILRNLNQNLNKIHHHGKRASGIIKGMLDHSRTGKGEKKLTNINILADEYLKLSYHGIRAKDKTFTADFKADLDKSIPKLNIVSQDIGRVILNLINNAFYACTERSRSAPSDYQPQVIVTTQKIKDHILISVKDNGDGIPIDLVNKIFQPFFTTKPTGKGTGLGLSLSYDIVKAHGGEIKVETKKGIGSEFKIILPLTNTR